MSAKWRALQHRHRYTYGAVLFPQSYIETLNLSPSEGFASDFFTELNGLILLNSTYSQVAAVKKVASAFSGLLSSAEINDAVVPLAARLYLEILFLENSLPLHRILISVLAKNHGFRDLIGRSLKSLCDEYGRKEKRFVVSRAALSLLSYPKLGFLLETIEECAVLVAVDAASGLRAVVSEISNGSRPSPVVMEQCQEAMSCLYYLLQKFPSKFVDPEGCWDCLIPKDSNIFGVVVREILNVLKSSAFSRDCLVAAGVSFCAALQVCLSPQELAIFILEGLFRRAGCSYRMCTEDGFVDLGSMSPLKEDLYSEIREFSILSRLCLLRGVLTAVPRTVLNICFTESAIGLKDSDICESGNSLIWTILFNGILPELCSFCENPIDSHFNFHALTVTQICLQQIKTSLLAKLTNLSGHYNPFPGDMVGRILRIIWNNLEDPLNQTVKQVHLIFDLFLDIQYSLKSLEGSDKIRSFLKKTALELLRLGARCKGRYVPLACLTKRLGAKTILDMCPRLLYEMTHAYIDDDVCCSATSFLKCFLECLRDECWSTEGIEKGYKVFRGLCLPPLLDSLVSGLPKLRSNLNTYALPVVLEVDVDSIFPMLAFISVGQSGEESAVAFPELVGANMDLMVDQRVAALVSLLKVSRSLALIEGDINWYCSSLVSLEENNLHGRSRHDFAFVCLKGINVNIPVDWLVLALTHVDDALRIDAAESLFLNPKTASLPSPLELSLLKEAVPLNMRCCSTSFQMKWTSMFRKFFSRVRTALERQVKQGCWQPLTQNESNEGGIENDSKKLLVQRAEDLFSFMKWLSSFLLFSCYPSAPYERKTMAMELILILINVWPLVPLPVNNALSVSPTSFLYPYSDGFILPDSTLSLVCSIIDSWDRLRESSFHILLHFPTPLPGISSDDAVKEVIAWAKQLVCSPRVRESDAGALTLRLIFRKYVLELGWIIGTSVDIVCFQPQSSLTNGNSRVHRLRSPVIEYVLSLVDWLRVLVEDGEKDLSEACKNSFVHGVLLALRYTFEELNWDSDVVLSSSSEMRRVLEKLLDLVMRITSLALWVVSADAWHLPEDIDDMDDDGIFMSDVPLETDSFDLLSELQVKTRKLGDSVRPTEQIVMVGCWLAMKEVSLLLATIIRKIPLSSATCLGPSEHPDPLHEDTNAHPTTTADVMLDFKQLETTGSHFVEVLLKMKHNGAIDKTRAGFTALCNRLLCSNDPRLCKMTESWMEQLMERTVAKGQTVDDLLRRSAGIPAAFIALFLSEPEGTPKKLLPWALRWLIDVAKTSLPGPLIVDKQNGDLSCKSSSRTLDQASSWALSTTMDAHERMSKTRDEGVIPTVHAFNVLRAAFNDTNLAADTSGFCAEALIISIRSFSSPYWEVRNSACLAYTALVRRMIGFLNIQKRESARPALTGLEFFHRYPALHPFLFGELKIATESLGDGNSQQNMAKVVHPSLCPILILLSRLKPSAISSEAADSLDPFVFWPFITRCATQSNLRVRILASRALTGLVSNEKLQTVLKIIACRLPHGRNQMATVEANSLMLSSLLKLSNSVESEIPHLASFNAIHGTLLQICALLDNNCRNLTDVSKKDQILRDLIETLVKCSWIGGPKSCPCPTLINSYLRVLDLIICIARTCRNGRQIATIGNLLQELSSQCLDADTSCRMAFYDPTEVELQRQAATSYFNCIFTASPEAAEEGLALQMYSQPASSLSSMPSTGCSVIVFQERLRFCLSETSYEIRFATLKWLLQFLKATESDGNNCQSGHGAGVIHMWAKTALQPTLMHLLAIEENPKCSYYILRILFSWNSLQYQKQGNVQDGDTIYIGRMDCDAVFHFWDKLISLNKVATHVKSQEALICCMGLCVKRFANFYTNLVVLNHPNVGGHSATDSSGLVGLERWPDIYECIVCFIGFIKQNSASFTPVNKRKAAAESIVASGLLEEAASISSLISNCQTSSETLHAFEDNKKIVHFEPSNAASLYAHQILDLWFICIKLLEDEDVGLRQRLAMDIQRCVDSKGSTRNHAADIVPTQVEKVIELSFEFLTSIFGHWLEYFNYLSRWVFEMASYTVANGDLVRQVFDKEVDNHHEERLLICQICCFHMQKLSLSKSLAVVSSENGPNKCDFSIFLHEWRMRFLHQLISFANNYIETKGSVSWIGGIGNHKDSFVSIYANLLGLYALSHGPIISGGDAQVEIDVHRPLLSGLTELRGIIVPFLRNPLIYNLYSFVIQSYEKMLGIASTPPDTKSEGDCSSWEGFDPYFLR